MTSIDYEFYRAVASLQLPIPDEQLDTACTAIFQAISTAEQIRHAGDVAIILNDAIEEWSLTSTAPDVLKKALTAGLGVTSDKFSLTSAEYLKAYARLRSGGRDWTPLDHSSSVLLLSRARLILDFVSVKKFSGAHISQIFATTERALLVHYNAIHAVAQSKGMEPSLDKKQAGEDLWNQDIGRSALLFADSNEEESCIIAGELISQWAPHIGERCALELLHLARGVMATPGEDPKWPYIQILHWCVLSQEFFDHPPTYLYEFSPRSSLFTETICGKYAAATGNPILNNAKAVAKLDQQWAMNRKPTEAHSLVGLLETIESLPYQARREVCRIIRAWIARLIELAQVSPTEIPASLSVDDYLTLTRYISTNETSTAGVIEQRIVDTLGILHYTRPGWKSRGIGDSVNASNISRKKLGDIEFANIDARTAIAIEAHGGVLTAPYVSAHHKSLVRIIQQRLDDSWLAIDDAEKWSIKVIFVGHGVDPDLPRSDEILGVDITYKYMDYSEFIQLTLSNTKKIELKTAFEKYFRKPINSRTVKQSTRDRVLELIDNTQLG